MFKNNNKGFTLIELLMVTIILGILAAVAVPRYSNSLISAEIRAEKAFVDQIWAGCVEEGSRSLLDTGIEVWPSNPLNVIGRYRGVTITLTTGIPDADGEWQFDNANAVVNTPAVYHHRRGDEIWYYVYDATNFSLSETPVQYIP